MGTSGNMNARVLQPASRIAVYKASVRSRAEARAIEMASSGARAASSSRACCASVRASKASRRSASVASRCRTTAGALRGPASTSTGTSKYRSCAKVSRTAARSAAWSCAKGNCLRDASLSLQNKSLLKSRGGLRMRSARETSRGDGSTSPETNASTRIAALSKLSCRKTTHLISLYMAPISSSENTVYAATSRLRSTAPRPQTRERTMPTNMPIRSTTAI
mmetsp:Transcript_32750/g.110311  ORF Transcript_32750/g.110311 Transcript_32750/m.110311 type:complete len:221 (+) Transcript_32750:172-834(+)